MGIISGGKPTLTPQEQRAVTRINLERVAANERKRAGEIFAHPKVQNGTAIQLGVFIATKTDLSVEEAHAMLDKAAAGNETAHVGGSFEAGRVAAENLLHPSEVHRRELQTLNDQAFVDANFGMVSVDRRTPREREKDEQFADIARGCRNRDGTASPNKPGNKKSDDESDDEAGLRAMGFGGSPFDRSGYEAGAAAAARILGKPTSHTAPRPANPSYARERPAPATRLPSPDAAYAQGAESAKRLLFGSGAVRAELDAELRQSFADQQRERAQQY